MAKKKEVSQTTGKINTSALRDILNKAAGIEVAYDLREENPTEVTDWIPTGSTWLDCIIAKGMKAGIPVGKISELAGETASGKSYMAAQIAANAQKKGIDVVYFDSESAIDPEFLEKAGCDLETLLYVQAQSVEFVLESIEKLMASNQNRMLFIWDSFALTPCKADIEGTYDPNETMAVKPRIMAKGLSKLVQPLANAKSTILVLNQLKTNLSAQGNVKYLTDGEKFSTPGGKALPYAYSLRIWLTGRRAKDSYIVDDRGYRVGSEVKARLEKSRFGTQGRECAFQISWGDDIGVLDTKSLFDAVKPFITQTGAWYAIDHDDGTIEKFQESMWEEKMVNDKFRAKVISLMDEHIIQGFKNKTGDAKNYYNIDGEDGTTAVPVV